MNELDIIYRWEKKKITLRSRIGDVSLMWLEQNDETLTEKVIQWIASNCDNRQTALRWVGRRQVDHKIRWFWRSAQNSVLVRFFGFVHSRCDCCRNCRSKMNYFERFLGWEMKRKTVIDDNDLVLYHHPYSFYSQKVNIGDGVGGWTSLFWTGNLILNHVIVLEKIKSFLCLSREYQNKKTCEKNRIKKQIQVCAPHKSSDLYGHNRLVCWFTNSARLLCRCCD